MNIESNTIKSTNKTDNSNSANLTSTKIKDDSKSFKNELATVKKDKETKTIENKSPESGNNMEDIQPTETQKANITQQAAEKNSNISQETKDTATKKTNSISDPINELNSKIAVLNEIKNPTNIKTQKINLRNEELSDKSDYCKTIKMDKNDAAFFVNLVKNQEMYAQNNPSINQGNINQNNFTEIKTATSQTTISVSKTLMDAINESAQTNKPFRVDFDNNIAVIMKVDKNGALSVNFIPGDAAVENYLRNNIQALRQTFDEQSLPYNSLSYSQNQKQQQKQQNKNKEK